MIALAILGGAAVIVLGAILKGWALTVLWGWFVVPTFDLPELTIAPAIGIGLLISYLTHQTQYSSDEDDKEAGKRRLIQALIL